MKPLTLSQQMSMAIEILATVNYLEGITEFLRVFDKKWDIIKNNTKVKSGTRKNK